MGTDQLPSTGDHREYSTPVKLRTEREICDKWSDPRDSQNTNDAAHHPQDGIAIPYILQPLFGIDFVPYMPASQPVNNNITEDLNELFDGSEDDGPQTLSLSGSEEAIINDLAASDTLDKDDEAIQQFVVEEPQISPSSKPRRRIRGSLMKLIKRDGGGGGGINRRRPRSGSKLFQRNRTGSWPSVSEPDIGLAVDQYSETASDVGGPSLIPNYLEWLQKSQASLATHQSNLEVVQSELGAVQDRATQIHNRVSQVQTEVRQLKEALAQAERKLQRELQNFEGAKTEVARLQECAIQASEAVVETLRQMRLGSITQEIKTPNLSGQASTVEFTTPKVNNATTFDMPLELSGPTPQPLRKRASTAPALATTRSSSFMRVHDLELSSRDNNKSETSSDSSSSASFLNEPTASDFLFVDHNVVTIVEKLSRLGYAVATDESKRFVPTRDTERLLNKYQSTSFTDNDVSDWSVPNWQAVHGNDVLVWTGSVDHTGFGHTWPVVKARGLVQTSPLALMEFLLDSSKVKEYNKMSQGRQDIMTIQEGLHTSLEESSFGFPGACKIIKALNKPKLIPLVIEMLSLMHSQPIAHTPGSYMTVSRSVFEDDSGEHKSTGNTIRSEMLLGVTLVRPANKEGTVTEMTTVTHVFSPGVPEMMAKRAAPGSAQAITRAIQNIFVK